MKNYQDLVTVAGAMAEIHVGSILIMSETWRVDKKYGRQFSMESYEETLPATSCRMVSFPTFEGELAENRLEIVEKGIAEALPEFDRLDVRSGKRIE